MNEIMNKTVSIIVPTYNGEKTLDKAINSLLCQTLHGIEIILIDDCSSDNTRDIIEKYVRDYPEIILKNPMSHNTRGSGLINSSVKIASGKYIAIVDQDDWVDPTMFEKLYHVAEREDAEVADCDCSVVDSDGNLIRIEVSNKPNQIGDIDAEKRKSLFVFPGWRLTKIFRKDFLLKHQIEHCDGVCYGDNYFMEHVAAYCNKIAKVNEPLYNYRVDTTSVTRSYNNPIFYDRVKSAELMLESLKKRGFLSSEYKEEIEFRFVELFYINSILIFLRNFKPSDVRELRYLRNTIRKELPSYRNNKYFKDRATSKNKLLTLLNDISPDLLCGIYRIKRKISTGNN